MRRRRPALGEKSRWLSALGGGGAAKVLIIAAAVLSFISIAFATLVLASYLARGRHPPDHQSLVFTASVAGTDLEDYVHGIRTMSEESVIDDLSRLAHLLAAGLSRKFVRINISLLSLVGAIVLALIASAWS